MTEFTLNLFMKSKGKYNNGKTKSDRAPEAQGGAAFVWQNGTMYDLNTFLLNSAGWNLLDAEGINDLGDIVGYGTIGGQSHAFLLTSVTPVPEPGTIALLAGLAVPGAAFVKRRRKK